MKMSWTSHKTCLDDFLRELSRRYREKKRMLDVGCGDGSRTLMFDEGDRSLYGIDRTNWLSKDALPKIFFHKGDFILDPWPYENESFDLVFSFDVIEHLPLTGPMMREIRRVLKKDGIFIISTPNRNRFFSFILLVLGLRKIPYAPDKATATEPYSCHVKEYTMRELCDSLCKAHFRVLRKNGLFYGLAGRKGLNFFHNFPFFHNIILECEKL